jgi:hypothetical protein
VAEGVAKEDADPNKWSEFQKRLRRLILDLMWSTGERVSEILAITPASFLDDRYNFGVWLTTLEQGAGRPSKRSIQRYRRSRLGATPFGTALRCTCSCAGGR